MYSYQTGSQLSAVAYRGQRSKAEWHFRFRSEEDRAKRIADFFASLDTAAKHKLERRAVSLQPHSLTVGDTVYNSWGYDQTNIDFYAVVRVSKNFVWLQPLRSEVTTTGFMQGRSVAKPGERYGDTSQHRVTVYDGRNSVHFEHGAGSKWDGSPLFCSWYA